MKENINYMNIKNKLTIVIPCRNEEKYIERTITSIVKQYGIKGTRVIIADANSTDNTRSIVEYLKNTYRDIINIELIDGGKVAYGRNKGSELVSTKYILFMDADVVLLNERIIDSSVYRMQHEHLDLMTSKIKSLGKDIRTALIFHLFNPLNRLISIKTPFAIGTFFLTKTDEFRNRDGFDETLQHSEDYALSRTYNPSKFRISKYYVGQDDRRFKKMGYIGMLKLVIQNYLHRNDIEHYRKDVKYWD
jgi:glycosyltransferase involved in cell wall biosynthesis